MNDKEFNKVDWINIIIHKRFQDYLNLNELQELSMMSKLTRAKLNPVLFKSIRLYTKHKRYGRMPNRAYNVESFEELSRIAWRVKDEIEKSINIKNTIKDINSELQNIKHYVNGIFIYDVKELGHCLYPILTNFLNLSVLKIHRSTIQYSIFQKLGEYFPMLKTFELYYVALSKEPTGNDNSNEIVFPFNLTYLSIWSVEITDKSISDKLYCSIFNDYDSDSRYEFTLPNISLPYLKNLRFLQCSVKDNGLEEFLKTNPNLEELSIDIYNPNMGNYISSLKSLHFGQFYKISNLENLIAHHNIKTLIISIENPDCYDKFEKLCLMCPSIELLHLSKIGICNHQEFFSTYLFPILKKLSNLKTVELPIYETDNEWLDINQFPQIEKIIFEHCYVPLLDIYFDKNPNLREIEFKATYSDINQERFMEMYKNYSEWEFKFFERKVKGYKIKN